MGCRGVADTAPTSSHDGALPPQGHIGAAASIGDIYYWGKGVAIDYVRAMAAYKIGAEGGDAICQYQVASIYFRGQGVEVDCKQAVAWYEKAAAQGLPQALGELGFDAIVLRPDRPVHCISPSR